MATLSKSQRVGCNRGYTPWTRETIGGETMVPTGLKESAHAQTRRPAAQTQHPDAPAERFAKRQT